jgi:hypothetical protein
VDPVQVGAGQYWRLAEARGLPLGLYLHFFWGRLGLPINWYIDFVVCGHPGISTGPARGAHDSQCLVAARCETRLGWGCGWERV